MKASEDRVLTTHIGSLPRGDNLTELLLAEDDGETLNPSEFQRSIDMAMAEVIDAQVEAGVDIGGDGEIPRISFSTYVAQRMSGFGGRSPREERAVIARG